MPGWLIGVISAVIIIGSPVILVGLIFILFRSLDEIERVN